MLLADFYSQQLKRQNASKIEVASGKPIRFSLPQGDREANAAISHAQVMQLVEEISTPEGFRKLPMSGEASLSYPPRNPEIKLYIKILDEQNWRVSITPYANPKAFNVAPPPAAAVGRYGSTGNTAAVMENPVDSPAAKPEPRAFAPAPDITQTAKQILPSSPSQTPASVIQPEARASEVAKTPAPSPKVEPDRQLSSTEPKLNAYLRKMIEVGASDLHMTSGMPPLVRLHGEMKPLDGDIALSNETLSEILLEVIPEQNAEQFQNNWDTDFAHAIEGLARFRANYFMDQTGIGAVFRQIPFEILTPEQLGLPEQVLDLCWLSKGLVLVTGPTGSGKSTTLASMIDYINRNRSDHIITIEDPVEFVHPNKKCLVNQREVGSHTKSFKNALKAALREDPDIVLVGEMRDLETISIAIETAETGHLVFGTLHTTTAPSTVDRIIDQFPADRQSQIRTMLAESLKGVVAQVLCKKKEKGRAAAYEILIANSAISNNIREGKTHQLKSIMQTAKKEGMCTMNDSLLELVVSGKVDAKEAYIKSVDKQGLKAMFTNKGIKLELDAKDEQ